MLRGKRVILLFYELSTRTRVSSRVCGKVSGRDHGADLGVGVEHREGRVANRHRIHGDFASGAEAIVIRHPSSGAPELLARHVPVPVINAGDGMHEHPSQGLLDAYTILEHKGTLKGLRVAIDIGTSSIAAWCDRMCIC